MDKPGVQLPPAGIPEIKTKFRGVNKSIKNTILRLDSSFTRARCTTGAQVKRLKAT